jgi:hypothetical protein
VTRWYRRLLVTAGVVVMGYAVAGAVGDRDVRLAGTVPFLAAVLAGHDLVLLPVAIGVGALVSWLVPAAVRGVVHAALFASAVVTVATLPLVIGAGRRADDPSALPRHYAAGLAAALVVVWVTAATVLLVRRARGKRNTR